jgi:transposase
MTEMQRAVHDAYFYDRMRQSDIAVRFGIGRTAVTMRLQRLRLRFEAVGATPPLNPGAGLTYVTPRTLPGD